MNDDVARACSTLAELTQLEAAAQDCKQRLQQALLDIDQVLTVTAQARQHALERIATLAETAPIRPQVVTGIHECRRAAIRVVEDAALVVRAAREREGRA